MIGKPLRHDRKRFFIRHADARDYGVVPDAGGIVSFGVGEDSNSYHLWLKEYKSEQSLKAFVPWLEANYHMTCTVSWGQDGVKELQGLEHIKQADVLFVFARRMKLDEGQMKLIRAHWEAGKAVIGVRTASHAFQAADNELFDRKVMGGNYQGHFGIEPVKVLNVAKDHPVLRDVGAIPTSNRLYKAGH